MKKYVLNKGFIVQTNGKNLTLFDPETSYLYTLNETATFVLNNIQKGMPINEITDQLIENYDISFQEAKYEVEKNLTEFLNEKILQ